MILFSLFADIIHSGESLCVKKDVRMPVQSKVSFILLKKSSILKLKKKEELI